MALDGLCEAKTTIPFIFARFSADPNLPKKTCERMRELALKEPGSYFVFCSRHRRLAHIDTTIPKLNEGFITDEQYRVLAVNAKPLWLRCLIAVAYSFGFRKGELLNLRVRQVDFFDRWLLLEQGTTKNDEG
jgi:integrase